MHSLEVITSVRVTSEEGLTPTQIIEIVQGIRKSTFPGSEGNNGPAATSPEHSGRNGFIILSGTD
jgi:hypothetical protein